MTAFSKKSSIRKPLPDGSKRLLSLLLNRKVKIRQILPNDSVRLGSESSLLYTDIIVQLRMEACPMWKCKKSDTLFPESAVPAILPTTCFDNIKESVKSSPERENVLIIEKSRMFVLLYFSSSHPRNSINSQIIGFTDSGRNQIPDLF